MSYIVAGNKNMLHVAVEEIYEEVGYRVRLKEEEVKEALEKGMLLEKDFEMSISPTVIIDRTRWMEEDILFVLLEEKKENKAANYYYHLQTGQWEKGVPFQKKGLFIVGYTESHVILVSDYLRMIDRIHQLGDALKKRVILCGHLKIRESYYAQGSLAEKIVVHYIEKYHSLLLLEDEEGERSAFVPRSYGPYEKNKISFYHNAYEVERLIESSLLPTQKRYESLEEVSKKREDSPLKKKGKVREKPLDFFNSSCFQGKGVAIGILTTIYGDYTIPSLKDREGKSRVIAIWEQEGEAGHCLSSQQGVATIARKENNQALRLCGGYGEGLATEAHFIIAKISSTQQSKEEVYFKDLKKGVDTLTHLAQMNHKPLVLIIPYSPSLQGNNGYKQWLRNIASTPGHFVIMAAGDKGDSQQYCKQYETEETTYKIPFYIETPHQEASCQLVLENMVVREVKIQQDGKKAYSLMVKKKHQLQQGNIQCTGLQINLETGNQEIGWSIKDLPPGRWNVIVEKAMQGIGEIKGWIENSERKVYFTKTNGIGTLEQEEQENMIVVGCYAQAAEMVYGFSGRGEQGTYPTLVLSDECMVEHYLLSTLEAAYFVGGLIACLYEKFKKQQGNISCEFLKKKILLSLQRTRDKNYPNKSEGYGILDLKSIEYLLREGGF